MTTDTMKKAAPADILPLLQAVARAQAQGGQPEPLFRALDTALAAALGHRLFTVLAYDRAVGQTWHSLRLYSNQPDAYPASGRKALPPGPWADTVLVQGHPYVGYSAQDLRSVFGDHELIASLGCQSVLNMPVRWNGVTVGSLNLLHEARWYAEADVAVALPFAQLALPALLALPGAAA